MTYLSQNHNLFTITTSWKHVNICVDTHYNAFNYTSLVEKVSSVKYPTDFLVIYFMTLTESHKIYILIIAIVLHVPNMKGGSVV